MNSCIVAKGFVMKALLNVEVPLLAGDDFEVFLRRTAGEIIDVAVREVISGLHLFILPPSGFFLVPAKIYFSLYLSCLDRVNRRLYVFLCCSCLFGRSPRSEFDFFWRYSLFSIQQLEWSEFRGP